MNITDRAKEILEEFPIHKEMMASISGKHHIGETSREHLELTVNVMKHLCLEFNINKEDTDMLVATAYLHDLGLYTITVKGKVSNWDYYEVTGYSRNKPLMKLHPVIGAEMLEQYEIPRKKEIQRLISIHMSHWYPSCPQPETFYERLLCIADYVACFGNGIFEFKR